MSEARPTKAPAGLERKKRMTGGPPLAEAPLMTPPLMPIRAVSKRLGARRGWAPRRSMSANTMTVPLMTAHIGPGGRQVSIHTPRGVPRSMPVVSQPSDLQSTSRYTKGRWPMLAEISHRSTAGMTTAGGRKSVSSTVTMSEKPKPATPRTTLAANTAAATPVHSRRLRSNMGTPPKYQPDDRRGAVFLSKCCGEKGGMSPCICGRPDSSFVWR